MKGLCAIFAALFAFGVGAAFAADEWGIEHEEVARIEATVVDILCELTGDCPAGAAPASASSASCKTTEPCCWRRRTSMLSPAPPTT